MKNNENNPNISGPGHRVTDRIALKVSTGIKRLQQRWADYMQRKTERLSKGRKMLLLAMLILIMGGNAVYMLYKSFNPGARYNLKITPIKSPVHLYKDSAKTSGQAMILSPKEYLKLNQFKQHMDSLARNPQDSADYNFVLKDHPGLMDSLNTLLELYQSQLNQ